MSHDVRASERKDRTKFLIFAFVAALMTAWLVIVTGDYRGGSTTTYSAVFRNVSGLTPGSEVRIAGVTDGRVESLSVQPDNTVVVRFNLADSIDLSGNTTATVRYQNLIGDRFLELGQGGSGGTPLAAGGTIPVGNTYPALDLDSLLAGFKPLFAGLTAPQINQLSGELVQVLQGEESAIPSLLSTLGSVTDSLGQRQQLIASVLRNLDQLMQTADGHKQMIGNLIDQVAALTKGVQANDATIYADISNLAAFSTQTAELLSGVRPQMPGLLSGLEQTSSALNAKSQALTDVLSALPTHYARVMDTASYGNFFNFFLCGVRLVTPAAGTTPWIKSGEARCQ